MNGNLIKGLVLALSVSVTTQVGAIEIRIDLNDVSTTGGNWNDITSAGLNGVNGSLIDFGTGGATAVALSGSGWSSFVGASSGWPSKDWVASSSVVDGAGLSTGSTGTFTLSGLSMTALYKVEIVSARTSFDYLDTITIGGGLANRTFNGTAVVTPWGATTDGLTPQNWLIWDNLTAAGGSLSISATASSSTLGILNAIRISTVAAVPEPGTLAMLALGMVGIGVRRRARATI